MTAPLMPSDATASLAYLAELCRWISMQARTVVAIGEACDQYNARAQAMGWAVMTQKTLERKYYRWKKSQTIDALADKRSVGSRANSSRSNSPRFIAYLSLLATRHQRKKLGAIDDLYDQWARCEIIPGYEGLNTLPNTPLPKGWTVRNLLRKMPDKRTMSLHQRGIRASAGMLAQVHSTRVGLWPCSHILMDDVWLDMLVHGYNEQGRGILARPLQLGALDYYTGKRVCWGTKLRVTREDGTRTGLNKQEMLLFLTQYLSDVGYSKRGTVLIVENGTAAISKDLELVLASITNGLVRVDRSGMTGSRQVAGQAGRQVGNPRHKAALESWHNLMHNKLDAVGLQVGHDRQEPEMLSGQMKAALKLIKAGEELPVERATLIQHNVPSMSDLSDKLTAAVTLMNNRTNHDLEGWEELGGVVDEYSLAGDSNWTPAYQLDADTLLAMQSLAISQPRKYRRRRMSPQELWEMSLYNPENELIRITPTQCLAILGADSKFKLTPQGGHFRLASKRRYHSELLFETVVTTDSGHRFELPYGAEYYGVFNPLSEALYVLDARDRCLGVAERVHRLNIMDEHAVHAAMGRKAQRVAEAVAAAEVWSAPDQRQREVIAEYNRRVVDGEPVTAIECHDSRLLAPVRQPRREPAAELSLTPCEGLDAEDWSSHAMPYAPADEDAWGLPSEGGDGSFFDNF